MNTQNALTRLHSYLTNFVPCTGSTAKYTACELFTISGTVQEFLDLIEQEGNKSAIVLDNTKRYADFCELQPTYADFCKLYKDVHSYLLFWQAQQACHVPAYVERYHGLHTPSDEELEELAQELDQEYRQAQFEKELAEIDFTIGMGNFARAMACYIREQAIAHVAKAEQWQWDQFISAKKGSFAERGHYKRFSSLHLSLRAMQHGVANPRKYAYWYNR